jgi:hypothetical protein
MNKSRLSLLLILLIPFFLGTTFIIKEGDREVGRYEENDGLQQEKILQNEIPPVPEVVPSPVLDTVEDEEYAQYMKAQQETTHQIYRTWIILIVGIVALSAVSAWLRTRK